jgi:hypothetical protein
MNTWKKIWLLWAFVNSMSRETNWISRLLRIYVSSSGKIIGLEFIYYYQKCLNIRENKINDDAVDLIIQMLNENK